MKKIWVSLIVLLLFLLGGTFFVFSFSSKDSLEKDSSPVYQEEETKNFSSQQSVRLTLVGDLLFESAYYQAVNSGDAADDYFELVKDYFLEDDLSIGNMEVVIGNEELPVSGGDHYVFCAPSWVGDLVTSLDFEVLSTANNHAFDQGKAGVISTIDYFQNHSDILTVGTFKKKEDTTKVSILEINGIKFGFLAYSMGTNLKIPEAEQYMVSLYKESSSRVVTSQDKERMQKQIEDLKKQVDVTVLLMHWGNEFTFVPNDTQKELAYFFNSLGVDLIVGNHSHNIQPIEWIGDEHKTLVYYSLGNFVSADEDIPRTSETFNNAYQMGLLSQLNILKDENGIHIEDVTTEPIINYYDSNLRNFKLVPYHLYTEEYEVNHYRYQKGFNKDFILNTYHQVIPDTFRNI